jgi:peptidoglycan/LPS O-acetylase OafA/YrhL
MTRLIDEAERDHHTVAVDGPAAQRFPALDGVRALAAFAVVCTHVGFSSGRSLESDLLAPILARGDFGVTVFFLLSGFLLYRPFALYSMGISRRPRILEYLSRRALRILPALIIFVVITLTWITRFRVRASDYLQYLLLIQTYDHHDYDPNLAQLWTLAIEVSFYLLLPVLAGLAARRAKPVTAARRQCVMLACLFLIAPAFTLFAIHRLQGTQALLWTPVYLDWFAAGMALAMLSSIPVTSPALARVRATLRAWAGAPGTCWLITAVLFLLTCLPLGVPRTLAPATYWQWTAQHYLNGAAAFFLLLPLVFGTGGGLGQALGSRPAHFLGDISYGVYLWHVPLLLLLQRTLGYQDFSGHFPELLIVVALAATGAATLSWLVVERPILRYGSRPWRGGREAPPIAATTKAATHRS